MKHNFKQLIVSIFFLAFPLYSFADNTGSKECIIIVNDTIDKNMGAAICNIKVIYNKNNELWEVLSINNYLESFSYLCRFKGREGNELLVFKEYGFESGNTKLYFFDRERLTLYFTGFIGEQFILDILSLDPEYLTIQSRLVSNTNCGEISYHEVYENRISSQMENLSNCQILETIMLD